MKSILLLPLLTLAFLQKTAAQQPSPGKLLRSAEILFDFGRHDLRPEADSTLALLAAACQGKPELLVRITAHTDSVGTGKNNQALSERRAETVSYALAAKGVPAAAMRVEVFGEHQPAAPNRTDGGRQRNRRAIVEVFQKMPMTPLEGKVVDPKTGKGVEADVVVRSKDFRDSTRSNHEGYWHVNVPVGVVVGVDIFAEGFFLETKMLKVEPGKTPPLETRLRPAAVGEKADIQNLYFVGNQAVLLETSKPELPNVLRFMEVNKSLKIEIAGHVNHPNTPPVVRESWEFKLSEARAKLVYDYLLENGVPTERVSWKGYGNWEMVFPNTRQEPEMAKNRRVEIRVVDKGR